MIKVQINRPCSIGVTATKYFESYSEAEPTIERIAENRANNGWNISELKNSNSKQGVIECTHDDFADIILIEWETV